MRGMYRSRSLARKQVKTPSGKTALHYKGRKKGFPTCSKCGAALHGTARGSPIELRRIPPRKRSPSRIYGGTLCPKCVRQRIKEEARQ
jgi:large subunit ribosomal protein L34e